MGDVTNQDGQGPASEVRAAYLSLDDDGRMEVLKDTASLLVRQRAKAREARTQSDAIETAQ